LDLHVSFFEFIFGFGDDGNGFLFIFSFSFVELFEFSLFELGDEIKGIVELGDIEIATGGIKSGISEGGF